jgi:hypothetical protein
MKPVTLERVASLIAAGGSVWFTQELTRSFCRIVSVSAPTGGPTEVIGLSVLLWIWAKYIRYQTTLPAPALCREALEN